MRRKIVLVGAGSAVFTKGLVLDIIERREEQWHIALVDTDERVLRIIERVCRKMIAQTARGSRMCLSRENTAYTSLWAIRSVRAASRVRCA